MSVQAGGGTPEDLGKRIREEVAEYRETAAKIGLEAQ
jgi:hypothetical protein